MADDTPDPWQVACPTILKMTKQLPDQLILVDFTSKPKASFPAGFGWWCLVNHAISSVA